MSKSISKLTPERRLFIIGKLRERMSVISMERKEQIKKACVMAAYCIKDAFAGRLSNGLASNSKKSTTMLNIFLIQTSDWFLYIILICCMLHSLSIFITDTVSTSYSIYIYLFNILTMVIYISDVLLKLSYQGFQVSK